MGKCWKLPRWQTCYILLSDKRYVNRCHNRERQTILHDIEPIDAPIAHSFDLVTPVFRKNIWQHFAVEQNPVR